MFEQELRVRWLLGPTELRSDNYRYSVRNETADQLVTDTRRKRGEHKEEEKFRACNAHRGSRKLPVKRFECQRSRSSGTSHQKWNYKQNT